MDPTSLANCRLVSKSWKALIDTRRTILVYQLQQLKQTKLEVPDAKVWYKLRRIVQSQRKHSIIEEFPEFRRAFLDLERNATGHELSIIVMFLQKYSKHQKFPIEKLRHYGWDKRILRSPLHQAIIHGDQAMVNLVNLFIDYALKKHTNLNVPDRNGLTAFHFACLHGKLEVVKLFLENVKEEFLQVNVLDQNGNSPLQLVCIGNQPETLQLLLDKSIQFGIDINTVDKNERTPLRLAAMLGHEKVVKVLLEASIEHEINVNAFDLSGKTPFITACENGHLKVAKLLIEESRTYGIDLNQNNDPFITYFLTINAWVNSLGGLVYGRRPDLWNPLLISYFICSNLFWLKSKINTNFFAEVSGCLVASLFYMIFVPLIDSRIRESYEYYLVPFFISTFTLICARVGLLDYLDSS